MEYNALALLLFLEYNASALAVFWSTTLQLWPFFGVQIFSFGRFLVFSFAAFLIRLAQTGHIQFS
jgi:hypothetical protein